MSTFKTISIEFNELFENITQRFFEGAIDLKDEMGERIFSRFENSTNQKVQEVKPYSTKEIYVSQSDLPRQVQTVGKRGEPIKSAYFPQGYSQLKQEVARPPLELTGRLKSVFFNQPIETTDNSSQFFIEGFEGEKVNSLNKLYNLVFAPSESEIELYLTYIQDAG
jgi:hypothetical protein